MSEFLMWSVFSKSRSASCLGKSQNGPHAVCRDPVRAEERERGPLSGQSDQESRVSCSWGLRRGAVGLFL